MKVIRLTENQTKRLFEIDSNFGEDELSYPGANAATSCNSTVITDANGKEIMQGEYDGKLKEPVTTNKIARQKNNSRMFGLNGRR